MRKLLLFLGCALSIGGALALLWYGYLQLETFRSQKAAARAILKAAAHPVPRPPATVIVPPQPGEPIGELQIPRLGLSVMVLEGTGRRTLRAAAGHVRGTAMPGATGNIGVAAHRDTFFRPLRDVHPGDEIVFKTASGTFKYVVDSTEIVDPDNVGVLGETRDPELTLVTCYPFYYVGPAPKRFIVHARPPSL
jgi:sortase A